MSNYPKEVQELIDAALEHTEHSVIGPTGLKLMNATKPFRKEKPAQVATLFSTCGKPNDKFLELTKPVRNRIGPTANVNRSDILEVVSHGLPRATAQEDADKIMQIIADAAPKTEDL